MPVTAQQAAAAAQKVAAAAAAERQAEADAATARAEADAAAAAAAERQAEADAAAGSSADLSPKQVRALTAGGGDAQSRRLEEDALDAAGIAEKAAEIEAKRKLAAAKRKLEAAETRLHTLTSQDRNNPGRAMRQQRPTRLLQNATTAEAAARAEYEAAAAEYEAAAAAAPKLTTIYVSIDIDDVMTGTAPLNHVISHLLELAKQPHTKLIVSCGSNRISLNDDQKNFTRKDEHVFACVIMQYLNTLVKGSNVTVMTDFTSYRHCKLTAEQTAAVTAREEKIKEILARKVNGTEEVTDHLLVIQEASKELNTWLNTPAEGSDDNPLEKEGSITKNVALDGTGKKTTILLGDIKNLLKDWQQDRSYELTIYDDDPSLWSNDIQQIVELLPKNVTINLKAITDCPKDSNKYRVEELTIRGYTLDSKTEGTLLEQDPKTFDGKVLPAQFNANATLLTSSITDHLRTHGTASVKQLSKLAGYDLYKTLIQIDIQHEIARFGARSSQHGIHSNKFSLRVGTRKMTRNTPPKELLIQHLIDTLDTGTDEDRVLIRPTITEFVEKISDINQTDIYKRAAIDLMILDFNYRADTGNVFKINFLRILAGQGLLEEKHSTPWFKANLEFIDALNPQQKDQIIEAITPRTEDEDVAYNASHHNGSIKNFMELMGSVPSSDIALTAAVQDMRANARLDYKRVDLSTHPKDAAGITTRYLDSLPGERRYNALKDKYQSMRKTQKYKDTSEIFLDLVTPQMELLKPDNTGNIPFTTVSGSNGRKELHLERDGWLRRDPDNFRSVPKELQLKVGSIINSSEDSKTPHLDRFQLDIAKYCSDVNLERYALDKAKNTALSLITLTGTDRRSRRGIRAIMAAKTMAVVEEIDQSTTALPRGGLTDSAYTTGCHGYTLSATSLSRLQKRNELIIKIVKRNTTERWGWGSSGTKHKKAAIETAIIQFQQHMETHEYCDAYLAMQEKLKNALNSNKPAVRNSQRIKETGELMKLLSQQSLAAALDSTLSLIEKETTTLETTPQKKQIKAELIVLINKDAQQLSLTPNLQEKSTKPVTLAVQIHDKLQGIHSHIEKNIADVIDIYNPVSKTEVLTRLAQQLDTDINGTESSIESISQAITRVNETNVYKPKEIIWKLLETRHFMSVKIKDDTVIGSEMIIFHNARLKAIAGEIYSEKSEQFDSMFKDLKPSGRGDGGGCKLTEEQLGTFKAAVEQTLKKTSAAEKLISIYRQNTDHDRQMKELTTENDLPTVEARMLEYSYTIKDLINRAKELDLTNIQDYTADTIRSERTTTEGFISNFTSLLMWLPINTTAAEPMSRQAQNSAETSSSVSHSCETILQTMAKVVSITLHRELYKKPDRLSALVDIYSTDTDKQRQAQDTIKSTLAEDGFAAKVYKTIDDIDNSKAKICDIETVETAQAEANDEYAQTLRDLQACMQMGSTRPQKRTNKHKHAKKVSIARAAAQKLSHQQPVLALAKYKAAQAEAQKVWGGQAEGAVAAAAARVTEMLQGDPQQTVGVSALEYGPQETVGDGNCAFHAILGKLHTEGGYKGKYADIGALEARMQFVDLLQQYTSLNDEKMPVALRDQMQIILEVCKVDHRDANPLVADDSNIWSPEYWEQHINNLGKSLYYIRAEELPILGALFGKDIILCTSGGDIKQGICPYNKELLPSNYPGRQYSGLVKIQQGQGHYKKGHYERVTMSADDQQRAVSSIESQRQTDEAEAAARLQLEDQRLQGYLRAATAADPAAAAAQAAAAAAKAAAAQAAAAAAQATAAAAQAAAAEEAAPAAAPPPQGTVPADNLGAETAAGHTIEFMSLLHKPSQKQVAEQTGTPSTAKLLQGRKL